MGKVRTTITNPQPKLRPALTPESRENQMVALAMDLVEQRLRDGTASSQETTHFLKLATEKSKLEREKLAIENKLTAAKIKAIDNMDEMKLVYENAIAAMRRYSGHGEPDEYEY